MMTMQCDSQKEMKRKREKGEDAMAQQRECTCVTEKESREIN